MVVVVVVVESLGEVGGKQWVGGCARLGAAATRGRLFWWRIPEHPSHEFDTSSNIQHGLGQSL